MDLCCRICTDFVCRPFFPDVPSGPVVKRSQRRRVSGDVATIDFSEGLSFWEELDALRNVTDDDVVRRLTRGIKRVVLRDCANVTDAAIKEVAEKCPNLSKLDVSGCVSITDDAITAVAKKCKNLKVLNVTWCVKITNAAITAVAENLPTLADLDASSCGLTALPGNIGKLSNLKHLGLQNNKLTALPESITKLNAGCRLDLRENPLQRPPLEVAERGVPALGVYFTDLEKGSYVAGHLKIVLCGDGEAGKTSLLNALEHLPNPRQAPDARTIHLDRRSVPVPVEGDDKVKELMVNFFDLGGQKDYVFAQAPFLTRSALYLLVVEAEKACDEDADEAVLRFITLIQTRVPDAKVQLVLSKIDDFKKKGGDVKARCGWLRRVVNKRLEDWRKAVQKRSRDKAISMIRVEERVLAVSVGEELSDSDGVKDVKDAVVRLALSDEFPNVGQEVPNLWSKVWTLLRAIAEHGDERGAIEAMLEGTATKPLGVDDTDNDDVTSEGAYRTENELCAAWILYCKRAGGKDNPDKTFFGALDLLEKQGGLFVDAGLVFLQPNFIIDLTIPLVDHKLREKCAELTSKEKSDFQKELDKFSKSHEYIDETALKNQLDNFPQSGELGMEALRFLWRDLRHVKADHYLRILQILHKSGIIFSLKKKENNEPFFVVFSQLAPDVPDEEFSTVWPEKTPEAVIERVMTVEFLTGGCPVLLVQRVVAGTHRFGESLCVWRKGVVIHYRDDTLCVRLVEEDSRKPKLVFSVRTKATTTSQVPWFKLVIELTLEIETKRLPGMDCTAVVCCCEKIKKTGEKKKKTVWASKRETAHGKCEWDLDVKCNGCGQPFLGTAESDTDMSDRAHLELILHGVQQIRPAIKAAEEKIIRTMFDLANGKNDYPSLFYVVPVQPSSGEGLMRRASSFFEKEMMIVFVCAESMKAVKYGKEPGLKFSVLRDEYRNTFVDAAKFWKKYGRMVQIGATLLTIAVKAAVNVNLEDLVPKEVSSAIGAVTTKSDFIEKYSGMISDTVDKGMVYVDMVEKLDKRREAADSFTGRDEIEAGFTNEETKNKIRHEYNADLKEFFEAVGYEQRVMQKTMKCRELKNGEWGWAEKSR